MILHSVNTFYCTTSMQLGNGHTGWAGSNLAVEQSGIECPQDVSKKHNIFKENPFSSAEPHN